MGKLRGSSRGRGGRRLLGSVSVQNWRGTAPAPRSALRERLQGYIQTDTYVSDIPQGIRTVWCQLVRMVLAGGMGVGAASAAAVAVAVRYANPVTSKTPASTGWSTWPRGVVAVRRLASRLGLGRRCVRGPTRVKTIATGADVRTSDVQSFPPTTGPLRGFRGRMEVRSEGYGPHRYPVLTVAYPYVAGRFWGPARKRGFGG